MSLLTERDQQILKHVARYRITTLDVLQKLFFPDAGRTAVSKVVSRLIAHGRLHEEPLAGPRKYLRLTARAVEEFGASRRSAEPVTEQTLPVLLAILAFCTERAVDRFTPHEFQSTFPELCVPARPISAYVVDSFSGRVGLALLLVDRDTSPRRLLAKVRKLIGQRYRIPGFMSLIQDRRFSIIVLTGFRDKQLLIQQAIDRFHRGMVSVRVEIVEELAKLLG